MDRIDKLLHIGMGACVIAMVFIAMAYQNEYETFMLNCKAGPDCLAMWKMEQTK